TDDNSLAGVVRAHVAAKSAGLKLLIGAEITPEDAPAVLLYAADAKAYRCLARLITRGRRSAEKGECRLNLIDVADHADRLLAAVVLPADASCSSPETLRHVRVYREIFPSRCYLAASLYRGPDDEAKLDQLACLSRQARVPLVATNDVHYHVAKRRF